MTRVQLREFSASDLGHGSGRLCGLSICFDLDGTLVDTAPDLVRVTNAVIAEEGVGPTDYKLARGAVGFGSRRLISDALARAGRSVSASRLDALQAIFLKLYADDIARCSKPFPGVLDTLQQLRAEGADLSVCTNKPGWLARPLLDALHMAEMFTRIVGGDEAPRSKPDPRHLFMTAGHRHSERIVLVGDAVPDMGAAHNAGALAVLVTYGYSHGPQIQLRADARLRTFRQLAPTLIDRYDRSATALRVRF
ncbi:MAG: HAD-IA family hydrolase [Pseudomonadota bacterium]